MGGWGGPPDVVGTGKRSSVSWTSHLGREMTCPLTRPCVGSRMQTAGSPWVDQMLSEPVEVAGIVCGRAREAYEEGLEDRPRVADLDGYGGAVAFRQAKLKMAAEPN